MPLRIHAAVANLRPAPNTTRAPLTKLPAGHPVEPLGPLQRDFRPCRAIIDGFSLDGFVHKNLLRDEINPKVERLIESVGREFKFFQFESSSSSTLCLRRGSNPTGTPHVDVVVAVWPDKAIVIGGNVGDTVKFNEIPLTSTGRVKAGNRRITTMARNF